MSAASAIRQLLVQAHHRVPCDAAAFVPPSRETLYFHSDLEGGEAARAVIEQAAQNFLIECRSRREPLVTNRVRFEPGGPLVGRFLVVAVHEQGERLAGIILLFRRADEPQFERDDARAAALLARQLTKVISLPADPMTGLLTRSGLETLMEWRRGLLPERAVSSVLYGDIDQLHVINDLLGFEAGDRAITAVAGALDDALARHDALLSRLSGDRFTIFLPDCPIDKAHKVAEELRDAVHAASPAFEQQLIPLSICFGAATLPAGERNFDHALAAAEVACKAAKDRGRDRVESYQSGDSSIIRRLDDISIVGRVRAALEEGRYKVFGQPIASLLKPEDTSRYEALLRIIDEKGRLVLPAHFMSSAIRYQLLPQIDRCVIRDVLPRLAAARQRPGAAPLHLSINLSGPSVSDPAFLEWLIAEIEGSGVPESCLTFELTESAAVSNLEHAKRLMSTLGERGCRFALDDFGTGLSSLAHLKSLDFSVLKIDGSFIRDILRSERSESLVRAIAQLAHAMGMQTVAEYVESPEICMRLIELEVQFGQGYAIGRPRALEHILDPASSLAHAG